MMEKDVPSHLEDAWIRVDEAADPGFYVRYLDASRAEALEEARRNPQAAFSHLALRPGLSVLDCGCGTGDMLAILAGLIAPGRAVGADMSRTMLEEARKRYANKVPNLEFEGMDVHALPLRDRSVDRVLATQLLVHVPDPRYALAELCRVTADGGRIAVADMDWDTSVLGSSDKELGRRFTRLFSDGVRHGTVVREYAGWLGAEGFRNVRILAQPRVFDRWDFFEPWMLDPSLPHFVAAGTMSEEEAARLRQDLADRSQAGSFFAASTFYTVVADRA
jgi:ubiquinone/menaquinone biosynthesis C-methylase UbiE